MATVRKTITFTEKQDSWIKDQVKKGDFTNDSEYLRSLVLRDKRESEKLSALRKEINEGIASGEGSENVDSIWSKVSSNNTDSVV